MVSKQHAAAALLMLLAAQCLNTTDGRTLAARGGKPARARKLIYNGHEVTTDTASQLGFLVAFFTSGASTPFCTGTLIDSTTVLTAAHCFYSEGQFSKHLSNVFVGSLYDSTRIPALKIAVHPDFATESFLQNLEEVFSGAVDSSADVLPNDLAVVRLSTPSSAPAASVPTSTYELADQQQLVIAGAGDIDGTDDEANGGPQGVTTPRWAHVNYLASNCPHPSQWSGTICAGGSSTTCNGDSGGPLLSWDSNGYPYVTGVTSYAHSKCGQRTQNGEMEFSIFTDVRAHYDAIQDMIARLNSS